MLPSREKPVVDGSYIQDNNTGLLVPRTYNRASAEAVRHYTNHGSLNATGFNQGLTVNRDEDTMVVRFPAKGSGFDDVVTEAIVDGNVANIGISPVPAPQITAMVLKQQNQAATVSLTITGKKSPVHKAREAILRFNDSPTGITTALMKMVHDLRTYNRGVVLATVPITYGTDEWGDYGVKARPIGKEKGLYYLDVDWTKLGSPVPYFLNVFDCEPTGNALWPYWYRKREPNAKKADWYLLHHTQVVGITSGVSSLPGIGTSSVWICLGYLAEHILVVDERVERMMNSVADGIIGISGVSQTSDQVTDMISDSRDVSKAQGNILNKGYVLFTSPSQDIKMVQVRFREPDTVDFEKRKQHEEDIIASAFGESLTAVVQRGGVGYSAQSEAASDNAAESGVGALLHQIGTALGSIYQKVSIALTRKSDRAQAMAFDKLDKFAQAVSKLPEGVFQPEQISAVINRDIMDIPALDEESTSVGANADDDNESDGVTDNGDSDKSEENTDDKPKDTSTDDKQPEEKPAKKQAQEAAFDYDIETAIALAFNMAADDGVLYADEDVVITADDVQLAVDEADATTRAYLEAEAEE